MAGRGTAQAFPAGGGPHEWGLMLTRKIPSEGAKYGWPDLERNHPRMWTQAARLRVDTPKRGSGLELVPGLTIVQQAARETPTSDEIWTGWSDPLAAARPSLDLRYGLTPSIGVTATVLPDFSQIEFDETPISLNSRFACYFPERRPFFLDGKEYFADIPETLYSRSIVDPIYGVKSFGKEGAWSIGAVHAPDRSPGPSVNQDGAPGFSEAGRAGRYPARPRATASPPPVAPGNPPADGHAPRRPRLPLARHAVVQRVGPAAARPPSRAVAGEDQELP